MARRVLGVEAFAEALASLEEEVASAEVGESPRAPVMLPIRERAARIFFSRGLLCWLGERGVLGRAKSGARIAGSKAVRPHAKQTYRIGTV